MSRALRELGLGPDADERAIKRAYAARLKTTRPDTDPEGFQVLNAAYQSALAWVQSRSNVATPSPPAASIIDTEIEVSADEPPSGAITRTFSADALFDMLDSPSGQLPAERHVESNDDTADDAFDAADHSATVADLTSEQPPADAARFDVDTFLVDCVAVATRGRDGELLDWLNAQPILWSLQHKAPIAQWLLGHLHEHQPAMEARRFDVLAEFFGLQDLHSGYDAYVIHRLRHRMHLAWEVQTGQLHTLAQRGQPDGGSFAADLRQTRRILKQLCRPLNTAQAVYAGLMPMYPSAVRKFLYRLDFGDIDDLPAPINPEQVAFWDAAGDRARFSKPRWLVSVARLVAYTLAATLAFLLCASLRDPTRVGNALFAMAWPDVAAIAFTTMSGLWLGYLAHSAFNAWQALPESEPGRMPWLRTASIPLLGIGILIVDQLLQHSAGMMLLAAAVCGSSLHRYRRRNGLVFGGKIRSNAWQLSLLFCGLMLLGTLLNRASGFFTLGIIGAALVLWAIDLRKQHNALES
jgi:hypothetical protein